MKLKILIIIYILFYLNKIHSQSIFSALRHDDNLELRDSVDVSEITTEIKFYNENNIEQKKETTVVNSNNKLVTEQRYNDDFRLTERISFLYDSTQTKSLSRKFEKWHPIIGYSFETANYEYDQSGFLIKVIDKNKAGKIFRETSIKNDDRGNPIELKLTEFNNVDYGMETAEYNYEDNSVVIKVSDSEGNVLSTNTMRIDYSRKGKNDIINEFGDLIKYDDYEFDFKYDKWGNWIKQIRYKIIKGKKQKNAEFNRRIKYKK